MSAELLLTNHTEYFPPPDQELEYYATEKKSFIAKEPQHKSKKKKLRICTKYNIAILFLAVILLAIGISVGLTVFFVIISSEKIDGRNALMQVGKTINTRLNGTIYGATRMTQILTALFSIK
jgi:preprotein translocase subunit SecG